MKQVKFFPPNPQTKKNEKGVTFYSRQYVSP